MNRKDYLKPQLKVLVIKDDLMLTASQQHLEVKYGGANAELTIDNNDYNAETGTGSGIFTTKRHDIWEDAGE